MDLPVSDWDTTTAPGRIAITRCKQGNYPTEAMKMGEDEANIG